MSTEIVFKKSNELARREKESFRNLFRRVFRKDKSHDLMEREFLGSPKGYSYHSLSFNKNQMVGAFSAVPYRYRFFGKDLTFALCVDTMIDQKHRGNPFHVRKMARLVHKELAQDGIPFIFGFPNENAYDYETQVLKSRPIAELDYYIVPRNIGTLVPSLRLLNPLSRLASRVLVNWPYRGHPSDFRYNIEKTVDRLFEDHRYGKDYHKLDLGDGATCVYRSYSEDRDVRATYLIDVFPLNRRSFARAVRRVYEETAKSTDILIYVGTLPFSPARILKVPAAMRPQKIRMTGKILIPGLVDDRVFSINNWNVNISAFDVR